MHRQPADSERDELQGILSRTLWGGPLIRAIARLRARHPDADVDVAAVEVELTRVAREIEGYLYAMRSGR